jgi:hypothetical protein
MKLNGVKDKLQAHTVKDKDKDNSGILLMCGRPTETLCGRPIKRQKHVVDL